MINQPAPARIRLTDSRGEKSQAAEGTQGHTQMILYVQSVVWKKKRDRMRRAEQARRIHRTDDGKRPCDAIDWCVYALLCVLSIGVLPLRDAHRVWTHCNFQLTQPTKLEQSQSPLAGSFHLQSILKLPGRNHAPVGFLTSLLSKDHGGAFACSNRPIRRGDPISSA